ncbi:MULTISPECIES: hypothetical protein [Nostocales]|uniref:Transposase n=2 Tax=Nostocales TaxID=1161 RepID=A0ABW8WF17_9CYAN|nr:hypothetical protein [Tolypothrix bouteillei]
MQPPLCYLPVELSNAERAIVNHIKRAKLFLVMQQVHHKFFG